MNILICNVGSTSLKYQLFDMDHEERVLASGGAERVGHGGGAGEFYHVFRSLRCWRLRMRVVVSYTFPAADSPSASSMRARVCM